jgi:drug/metabolite transporter (DMT)-like permease
MSAPPLALSWPEPAVPLRSREAGLLAAVALASFLAQLLLTRAFQLLPAARASAMGFTTVIYGRFCFAVPTEAPWGAARRLVRMGLGTFALSLLFGEPRSEKITLWHC